MIGEQRRRWAFWLGAAAIFANLLLALAPPQATSAASGRSGGLLDDLYVICTSAGLITLDEAEGGASPDPGATGMPECVFCLPLSNPSTGSLTPVALALAPRLANAVIHFALPPASNRPAGRSPTPYHTRAPPVPLATG